MLIIALEWKSLSKYIDTSSCCLNVSTIKGEKWIKSVRFSKKNNRAVLVADPGDQK